MKRRNLILGAAGLGLGALVGMHSVVANSPSHFELPIEGFDHALLPREHGQWLPLLPGTRIERIYPSRDHCMQMAAFFNDGRGVLVHTQDAKGGISRWTVRSGHSLEIDFVDPPSQVWVTPIAPHWQAAAEAYGDWARQQRWATQRRRSPIDLQFVATAASRDYLPQRDRLLRVRDVVGSPIAAWLTQWRDRAFDVGYPRYVAHDERAFGDALQRLRADDIIPLPYVNGMLWDAVETHDTPAYALRDRLGITVSYNRTLASLHYACPLHAEWQSVIASAQTSATARGIYLDMLMAANPLQCFASGHPHAPGAAYAWQTGVRQLLTQASGVVMSEGCAEIYLDLVDLPLMHLYANEADAVPLWHAVYGDVCAGVGWQIDPDVSPQSFAGALERAKSFGARCHGSPWLHHRLEEKLFEPGYGPVRAELARAAQKVSVAS